MQVKEVKLTRLVYSYEYNRKINRRTDILRLTQLQYSGDSKMGLQGGENKGTIQ